MTDRSPPTEPHLATGTVLAGIFRVLGPLIEGGMGTLYLAENTTLPGLKVVVKALRVPDAEGAKALEQEAGKLIKLRHPTVVQVLGYDAKHRCLVMELLDGETLADLKRRLGRLDVVQAVRLGSRIADALEATHREELVHRDVKPSNIMLRLTQEPSRFVDWVKLIDFGLSLDSGARSAHAMGTPEYVSPEQARNEPAGPAADIYALGVILFELLTGELPFEAPTVERLLGLHMAAPVPRASSKVPGLNEEIDALVLRMMSKNPWERPTAADVARRLARLDVTLTAERGTAPTGPLPGSQLGPQERATLQGFDTPSRSRLARIAVAAVLLGGVMAWVLLRSSEVVPVVSVASDAGLVVTAPVVMMDAAVAVAPVAVVDEPVAPLPVPRVAAPKPKVTPSPADCTPDERWRRAMTANMTELGAMASSKGTELALWFDREEPRVSGLIRAASTSRECGAAESEVAQMQRAIERK